MFNEYRDLITELKYKDQHFERMFNRHDDLDREIQEKERHLDPGEELTIEQMKKEKLRLKDEIFLKLREAGVK